MKLKDGRYKIGARLDSSTAKLEAAQKWKILDPRPVPVPIMAHYGDLGMHKCCI
jgi:hypothetical protein